MEGRKIIVSLTLIIIILMGIIYNFIKKDYLNNEKIILKTMSKIEYEDNITELNKSHEDYANYIEESKKKIASAITDMGIDTLETANSDTMASNIRSISRDASSISYDNANSELISTNIQGAVDELDSEIDELNNNVKIQQFNNLVGINEYFEVKYSKITKVGKIVNIELYIELPKGLTVKSAAVQLPAGFGNGVGDKWTLLNANCISTHEYVFCYVMNDKVILDGTYKNLGTNYRVLINGTYVID